MATKKQCKKGYSCGKSCISVSKACRVSFSEGVSVNLETRAAQYQSYKTQASIEEVENKVGLMQPASAQAYLDSLDEKSYREWVSHRANRRWAGDFYQNKKVKRLLETVPGLEKDEAMGIAAWISFDDYKDLNRAIYAPESLHPADRATALYANEMITEAVKKLPKTDRDAMVKLQKEKNSDKTWTPPGEYLRGLSFDSTKQLEDFVSQYRDNVGGVIQEQTHFAASGFSDHGFLKTSQLIYRLKARDDGKGKSVTLDEYKNNAYEAEIFYAAGQNFKVLGVKETDKGYEIELEES